MHFVTYGHLLVVAADGILMIRTDSVVPYTSTTAYGAYNERRISIHTFIHYCICPLACMFSC